MTRLSQSRCVTMGPGHWKPREIWSIKESTLTAAPRCGADQSGQRRAMSTTTAAPKGLEGIVAANSSICYIDGDAGVLAYRGIDIHELAEKSTFEETCYLLWFGRLPKRAELNASTFAARVTAATMSDMHSAITSAIGALKGPLHGGANEAVMRILFDIDKKGEDPVEHVKNMLADKKKIPGFGHRVYHTEDPRATHLRAMSRDLGRSANPKWYEMSAKIEQYIKNEKHLNANVDFYSASTYTTLGLDVDLFTPVFAVSRISGWAAHVIEQLDDNRLIRPRADYIGPAYPNKYVAVEKR